VKRWRTLDIWSGALIVTWAIVAILLLYPLWSVLQSSLVDNDSGAVTIGNYIEVVSSAVYQRALINTFIAGFGGMAGALVLGVTLAFLITRHRIRGAAFVSTLAVVALVSPPFIGAYSWIILFGANGVVRNALGALGIELPPLYGAAGIILVFSFKFFPHVFLITSGALAAVNRSLEEAAESLGLTPTRRFFRVTLKLILPAVSAGALLTFVLSIADFGTPRIIGRGFQVLATEAFVLFSAEIGGNLGLASTISIVLIVVSMIFVALQRYVSRRDVYSNTVVARPTRKRLSGWRAALAHGVSYLIVLVGALPALIVVIYSFRHTRGPVFHPGFSVESYERVMHTVPQAISNSLIFASASVAAILVVGTLAGYVIARRPSLATGTLDATLMVPYIIPGIVMGIAFIASFNAPPLAWTGTGLIIIMAVFIRRLPYGTRATVAALKQLSPNLEQAAISLGYHPARAFLKVTAPIILPGVIAGGMMSFVTAMNELSSSLVLYVGETITMPVRIYLLVLDGEYGTASALSTILLSVTGVLVYGAFRLSGNRERSLL
jgi:iron(III) transport system permease protein